MSAKNQSTTAAQYRERFSRALEAFGLWIPVLVILPVANVWPQVFWHAFGSGSLFAAATLIILTLLSRGDATVGRIFTILAFVCLALMSHGILMYQFVTGTSLHRTTAFGVESIPVWISALAFGGLAVFRTRLLIRDKMDFPDESDEDHSLHGEVRS